MPDGDLCCIQLPVSDKRPYDFLQQWPSAVDKDEHLSSEQEVTLPWCIIPSPRILKLGNFLSWFYDLLFNNLDVYFFPLWYLSPEHHAQVKFTASGSEL